MTSTLLTKTDDALTAAAIVIGGAFAILKFIKGRVLTAAVGYEIRVSATAHAVQRLDTPLQAVQRAAGGQRSWWRWRSLTTANAITVPRDSEQLVLVSSVTAEELAKHGRHLTPGGG